MSLDMAQDASAVTDLIFAGLKVAGYSAVTICSVLGSQTIKYYWHKEERMKETVAHWRYVLSHLTETQKNEIGLSSLRCMIRKLDLMEGYLNFLEINVRRATLWSRTVGKHAGRVRKLGRMIDLADDDLTARTEKALYKDDICFEVESGESASPEPSADPRALSVVGDQNTDVGRDHVTTSPCVELAQPSSALLASDRQRRTTLFTAAPQYMHPFIPLWSDSDYGDNIV